MWSWVAENYQWAGSTVLLVLIYSELYGIRNGLISMAKTLDWMVKRDLERHPGPANRLP